MERAEFICHSCGGSFPLGKRSACPNCKGILTVEYSDAYLNSIKDELKKQLKNNMWDYQMVLPFVSEENRITFGEGGTKLIKGMALAKKEKLENLYFKEELSNPTGSFKDRSVSMCVSMAKELKCGGIVVSSSGNGGAAASAYGKKAGMDTLIFVPETTPVGKVAQALIYGGTVIKVKGNFSNSYNAAKEMAEKKGYMNVTTTFLSPFGLEGYKVIGYEIFEQLGGVPDYIVIPVGAGPVLYGIGKAFQELKKMKIIEKMPRLVCVQASGCAPISQAWMKSEAVKGWPVPQTVASAICDPLLGYEQDGDITVEAIRQSGGYGITVNDEEIIEAGRELAREEGLFAEPASAAAWAGVKRLKNRGLLAGKDSCICLLTGHGLKDSQAYLTDEYEIPVIDKISELSSR